MSHSTSDIRMLRPLSGDGGFGLGILFLKNKVGG